MIKGGSHFKKMRANPRSYKQMKRWTTPTHATELNKHRTQNLQLVDAKPNQNYKQRIFNKQFKIRKPYNKHYNALDAPGAPLNTTTYIINSKLSFSPSCNQSPCPNFDGYGSMKDLLCAWPMIGREGAGDSQEPEEDNLGELRRETEDSGIMNSTPPPNHGNVSGHIELRIRLQDERIACLEEEGVVLKERLVSLEQELVALRHRTSLLELSNNMRLVEVGSCNTSFD